MSHNILGRRYRDNPTGIAELMRPMVGTPDASQLPELQPLIKAVADNLPLSTLFKNGSSTIGTRDMLEKFEKLTGQAPALLVLWRAAMVKTKRECDMHAIEHARGIKLALKKRKEGVR